MEQRRSRALGRRGPHVVLGGGLRLGRRELLVSDRPSALVAIEQEVPRAALLPAVGGEPPVRPLAALRCHGASVHALRPASSHQGLAAHQPGARLRELLCTEGDVLAKLPQDGQRGADHEAHLETQGKGCG